MSGITAAAIAVGVTAAGSVAAAKISSDAASSAAKTQSNSAQAAMNQTQANYNTQTQQFAPYLAAGQSSVGALQGLAAKGPQWSTPFTGTAGGTQQGVSALQGMQPAPQQAPPPQQAPAAPQGNLTPQAQSAQSFGGQAQAPLQPLVQAGPYQAPSGPVPQAQIGAQAVAPQGQLAGLWQAASGPVTSQGGPIAVGPTASPTQAPPADGLVTIQLPTGQQQRVSLQQAQKSVGQGARILQSS